jgi:hypothetical protein
VNDGVAGHDPESTADTGNFETVGQPGAYVIISGQWKNLRFILQAAER